MACANYATQIKWHYYLVQYVVLQLPLLDMLSFQVLVRATVFARMTPDQKTQLVKELQKLKWVQTKRRRMETHK